MKQINKIQIKLFLGIFACTSLHFVSCKKIVTIDPPYTSVSGENVYNEDGTAISAITGIYVRMVSSGIFTGSGSLAVSTGLSSDELNLVSGVTDANLVAFYTNNLVSNSVQNLGSGSWSAFYNYIYLCNLGIEGISKSNSLSTSVKQQLLGEAKFLRAFNYFYLVNLYGDLPLTLSTDFKVNSLLSRSSKKSVIQFIISELTEAKDLLALDYLDGNLKKYSSIIASERVRPTKWAVMALLSKAYILDEDYLRAENEASSLINNVSLFSLAPINSVFLKNSTEAIWQLQPVTNGKNTEDASTFILTTSTPPTVTTGRPVYLSNQLLSSFENNDKRRMLGNWVNNVTIGGITYHYPYKYKNNGTSLTEYLMVFRLAEQYLIRAEARAQLGNIGGSQSDLNTIRTRAGLPNSVSNDKSSLLAAIFHERQVELFTEWGSRWFDLKRTGSIDIVMASVTPLKSNGTIQWQSYQQLYPIPFGDIEKDPNLSQNPGY